MMYYQKYKTEGIKKLKEDLKLDNIYSVPKVTKVVLNIGVGEVTVNKNAVTKAVDDLTAISGQKVMVCKARKAVSAFKIRKGMDIGVKVTLRGNRMYDFLEKLTKIVLPRIREFKGISSNSLDSMGNLNIGINDQTLFPEIDYDKIDKIRGLEISIITNAKSKEAAIMLLRYLGFPINT